MDTAAWVWIVVAIVVVALIVVLLMTSRKRKEAFRQKRDEQNRQHAAEIRSKAENADLHARENEARAHAGQS